MAGYNDAHFVADYQFGIFKNTRWSFQTADAIADLDNAGYFTPANATYKRRVQVGDEILATQWTTAVPAGGHPATTDAITARSLLVVVQVDLATGAIDTANGDARTLTDGG